jgi:SAM-dependent methyltransferase
MFNLLASSKISINRHGEVAENYANNMRLFEVTGCGSLLVTDYKDNLSELFKIGEEIVAFRSPEECVSLVKFYLANPKEAETIASAGRRRTLKHHTYQKRMAKTSSVLKRHLRAHKDKNYYPAPDLSKISYGYATIEKSEVTPAMRSAWQKEFIPERQRALVQSELESTYQGKPPVVFQVLVEALEPHVFNECPILEIGCASGYYYEILEYLLNLQISYTGVDFSKQLITMAKDYYPNTPFYVADGASLPFSNNRFYIAISSCVLLHVLDYPQHISETARVADKFVVAHRTPVRRNGPTKYYKKYAYGEETVELHFNEQEIVSEFHTYGLSLLKSFEYSAIPHQDFYEITYIFEKTDESISKRPV